MEKRKTINIKELDDKLSELLKGGKSISAVENFLCRKQKRY